MFEKAINVTIDQVNSTFSSLLIALPVKFPPKKEGGNCCPHLVQCYTLGRVLITKVVSKK